MSTLRPVRTPESFIAEARTAPQPGALNPRVIRQLVIRLPETRHAELALLVRSLPDMSMQRFVFDAIEEKIARTREAMK